jgi:hypothetical protein
LFKWRSLRQREGFGRRQRELGVERDRHRHVFGKYGPLVKDAVVDTVFADPPFNLGKE